MYISLAAGRLFPEKLLGQRLHMLKILIDVLNLERFQCVFLPVIWECPFPHLLTDGEGITSRGPVFK